MSPGVTVGLTARGPRWWAARVAWSAAGCLGAQWAPATAVLPTFLRRPPRSLGAWCHWRGPETPSVALTFDDGPTGATEKTLDLLETHGLRATFFLLGQQMRKYPDLTREIVARGHEVGLHGDRHRHHLLASPATIRRDFDEVVATHHDLLGTPARFYRPTYGQLTLATVMEARRHGLETVLWSRWGKEFAETQPSRVLARLRPGLRPGAILLLHDSDVAARAGTAALTHRVLPELATLLTAAGMGTVTVGQLLAGRGVGPESIAPGRNGS
jgi:peptidoglycan/xylan/chitin deacetylase (PgdA/CDA1 family)